MITEYVKINGINLWEKGFFAINMDSGLRTSPIIGTINSEFDYAINNKESYLIGKTYEPISFPMMFTTNTGVWSEEEKSEFLSIVDNDNLIELSFKGDFERVYFVSLQGQVIFSSNDGFTGFYSLEFISNYPYALSEERTVSANVVGSTVLNIYNEGDLLICPELNIIKTVSTGAISFSVKNNKYSTSTATLSISELFVSEELYVDNRTMEIVSSLPNTYRYSKWNNKKIELEPGLNELTITGNCSINIKYRFIYRR